MRLSEFKIQNFRSIVDSGWNTLSNDNITALIGQNESGKTSVLEALYSFFEGTISEDVLRSDLSIPEISCAFIPDENESFDFIDTLRMPAGVISELKESRRLVINRKWFPDLSSQVNIAGEHISAIFDDIEEKERFHRQRSVKAIEDLIREYNDSLTYIKTLEEDIISFKKEIDGVNKKLTDLRKVSKRTSDISKLDAVKNDLVFAGKEAEKLSADILKSESELSNRKADLSGKDQIREHGEKCLEIIATLKNAESELENAYTELSEVENSISYLTSDKEQKAASAKLFDAKEKYIRISRQVELMKEASEISIIVVDNLLAGKNMQESEQAAKEESVRRNTLFSRQEAGEVLFSRIPRFEFFEDFSSLLPNRIDLEDIFEDNNRVEGYKAVRNFLVIAGLDPEFFRQTNNRILKQKIENLNNEVTVDFQEYWRQNIGKTNKIRIHFELEHYDTTHPEKKGKPYLEFWIKDQRERLYPKQRSRGVRWFLSFYLELRAFARDNANKRRVLLIDEPGLSLHARAQEDVLKVFEDIRGNIQIIYTTHSPHLIDHNKLYRLLAVQRANANSEQSETIIFDASHLHSASSDTLSPVSSLMGTGLTRHQFVKQGKNIIVEDICSFYYMSALYKLTQNPSIIYFLPANGPAGVTILVNLLIGWGFDFSVLLFDNVDNQLILEELNPLLAGFEHLEEDSRIILAKNISAPEDIFSTLDFKKCIIKKRVGISESNSAYITQNEISRPLLAASFAQAISSNQFTISDFDEETLQNLKGLFDNI